MAQQHGSVAGRVAGDGNTSTDQQAGGPDLGDPATDLIGTWRLQPTDPYDAESAYHRAFDLDTPRAVKVAPGRWALVDLADRIARLATVDFLRDDEIATWPYTTATMVAAAGAIHAKRTGATTAPVRLAAPVVGEEDPRLFR